MFVNIYKLHRPGVFYISITFKGFCKCMYWKKLLKERIFHTVSHLFIWSFIHILCSYFDTQSVFTCSKLTIETHKVWNKVNNKDTRMTPMACAYQGIRNVCFSENLAFFVFLKHPFWDSPFCLITDEFNVGL